MKYRFLPHTADIKFQANGKTLNEVFKNAALALANYITKGKKIKGKKTKIIQLKGTDKESLFYAFLDELIFLLDAESFVLSEIKVKINKLFLTAELKGDDATLYSNLNHIKAATYAEMYIKKTSQGFQAQAVLDV